MPLTGFESARQIVTAPADIAILSLVIYWLLTIVRGTRAAHLLFGVIAVAVTYRLASAIGLAGLQSFFGYIAPFTAISLVVLFQTEIRRSLSQLGRQEWFGGSRRDAPIEDIVLALEILSRSRTGALIVIERQTGLRTFVESGVRMDAHVSPALLVAIFQHESPLHDGAVIIQKGTIAAAACFLPLATRPVPGVNHGSRHRAALGITEDTDCISLVVSENSGELSVAIDGGIQSRCSIAQVREQLTSHFGRGRIRATAGAAP